MCDESMTFLTTKAMIRSTTVTDAVVPSTPQPGRMYVPDRPPVFSHSAKSVIVIDLSTALHMS